MSDQEPTRKWWADDLHRPTHEPHYSGVTITVCPTCDVSWPCDVSRTMTLDAENRRLRERSESAQLRTELERLRAENRELREQLSIWGPDREARTEADWRAQAERARALLNRERGTCTGCGGPAWRSRNGFWGHVTVEDTIGCWGSAQFRSH